MLQSPQIPANTATKTSAGLSDGTQLGRWHLWPIPGRDIAVYANAQSSQARSWAGDPPPLRRRPHLPGIAGMGQPHARGQMALAPCHS